MSDSFRPITLLQPSRIVMGAGAAETAARDLVDRGLKRIGLVVTRRAATTLDGALGVLRAAGVHLEKIEAIPAEPTVRDFENARAQLKGQHLDAIIGCGGGSALDVAKLLAGLHGRDEPVSAFVGSGLLPPRRVYLACLPTTSGSGSEVSPNAILLDDAASAKKAVISPHLVPDAAYVDPALLISAPPALTAATGIDALVHCIEAYANRRAHPAVDPYALAGIRLISTHLPTAVRDGGNLEARNAVALGALYGGLCLGPVNTGGVHALAYPLGSVFHLAHGLANALMLVPVLRFNLSAAPDRYAEIALALGVQQDGRSAAQLAEAGLERLRDLRASCGVPRSLNACGLTRADIPTLVSGAMQITRLLQNNPREITAQDATEIFNHAFS